MFPEQSDQDDQASDLMELEKALKSLAPRANTLDRDTLMFRAGQASVARPTSYGARWRWPLATAAAALLAAIVGRATTPTPEPRAIERLVEVRVPVGPVESTASTPAGVAADDLVPPRAAQSKSSTDYRRLLVAGAPARQTYLALRDQPLSMRFNFSTAPSQVIDEPTQAPKSCLELRDSLLAHRGLGSL